MSQVRQVTERSGTIEDAFNASRKQGTDILALIRILNLTLETPIWAYESHGHLVLMCIDQPGEGAAMSIMSLEDGCYSVVFHHPNPLTEIGLRGEVRYAANSPEDCAALISRLVDLAWSIRSLNEYNDKKLADE